MGATFHSFIIMTSSDGKYLNRLYENITKKKCSKQLKKIILPLNFFVFIEIIF